MTTILSLASRDFIVVGCDSLATQSTQLLNPQRLLNNFFHQDGTLKLGQNNEPLLTANAIWEDSKSYPVNQLPSVMKLFDLAPKKASVLFAGASRIGKWTVKNLVESFKQDQVFKKFKKYTIKGLAERLKNRLLTAFADQFQYEWQRPEMEILLSGYSAGHQEPEVYRLLFYYDFSAKEFHSDIIKEVDRGDYNLVFGGQYDVIQRIIRGVDFNSYVSLKARCHELLNSYREQVIASMGSNSVFPIPAIDPTAAEWDLFNGNFGGVVSNFTDIGSLSEQAGIDLVTFLINTMIKSQEFSTSIPTVGGDIHIGLITSDNGFRWISKEEYKAQDHSTPKFSHANHKHS